MPFEDLAFPLMDGLFSTALRMCGHRDRAQDLVQDTMIKGFKNFHRFEVGSNFRAWMYTILTNTFINDYRRRKREPISVDMEEVPPEAPAHVTVTDVDAMRETLGDEAAGALNRLPSEFRLIFLLSTFEGFSYEEISGITGIPIGTVMSRLFRARKLMRDELLEYARRVGHLKGESNDEL